MSDKWSLDDLYTSFESKEFSNDFSNYKKHIECLITFAKENFSEKPTSLNDATKKIETYLKMQIEFDQFGKLFEFAQLTIATEALNEKAAKILDILSDLFTETTAPSVMFQKYIGEVEDLEYIINSSEILKEHSFILNELKEQTKYMLNEPEEIIISKMQNTGSSSWSKLKEQLASTLLVDITKNNQQIQEPLTVIRNYAYEADKSLRENAYIAELKSYEKIDKSVAACLNAIKGEVITTAKLRGYTSPLEMTLIQNRMDKKTLDAMFAAIKEYLPVFEKYFINKAKRLGHKGSLPFYDLFAPIGEVNMTFTYQQAKDFVVDNFTKFSKKLGDYATHVFDNNWIDVYPREGKSGGAFCSGIHSIKQSRILTNFGSSFNDVTTLAHELGHGYHNECLKNESPLNADYSMPIAETASTFCETIIINAALKTATKEEALVILENDISGAAQVIVDIYSRFLFEDEVFRQRENGSLSVNELKEIMLKSQKQAYGNGLDHECLHPYMWACKTHYYYADANYYNFPYAYGFLFSKGLYAKYLQEGDAFVKDYDDILSRTGKNNLFEIGKLAGIDVSQEAFWRSSLQLVAEQIEEFIKVQL